MNRNISLLFVIITLSLGFIPFNTAEAVTATGGTITYSGDYTIHTFTSSGTFTVTVGGDVDYLIVGGGGGGGSAKNTWSGSGGGGAGAFRNGTSYSVTPQAYTITVGAGGTGGVGPGGDGTAGGNSIFDGMTAEGGGEGGSAYTGAPAAGSSDGSGGGDTIYSSAAGTGGTYGNDGGTSTSSAPQYGGSGGGGAGAVGGNGGGSSAGNGGIGLSSSINGTSVVYAAGGGGSTYTGSALGVGGSGIGGDGGATDGGDATGYGSGGGGASAAGDNDGGNGSDGIVIIRYLTVSPPPPPTGLTPTGVSISQIDLDWDDAPAVDNITGFRIFQESPVGGGWIKLVNDTGSSTSSYSDTGLSTKTQYNYMVAGINATGVGNNSTQAAAYTWGVPDAPTGFSIIDSSTSSLTLNYTSSTQYGYPVTGYEVWRNGTMISADIGNVTSYINTGLASLTVYDYGVRALSSFGSSAFANATGMTGTDAPTSLIVDDCYHTCTTQLNLEWVAPVVDSTVNGYKIETESPIGNGWTTLVGNTTTTTTYYNHTGLATDGVFHNYRVSALTVGGGTSDTSSTYAYTTHILPDSITDLTASTNSFLQFLLSWSTPSLHGTLSGYNINYTTPAGEPLTVHIADSSSGTTSATISALDPTLEYSFRVSAITNHGKNVTFGNIANATLTNEIEIGAITISTTDNPIVESIDYVLYNVDSTTDNVQVQFDPALTVDCTVTHRIAGTSTNYTSLSETTLGSIVYHNFTVTNAGNDVLDFDCWDQTDTDLNGQYSLSQGESSTGFGGVPLFSQINDFRNGLYGTEGELAGIDLMTLFIVIVSMLGFNRKHPALGVGVMATLLGAAWYYEIVPWTSGVLGGVAMVLVLAIGQGIKRN